MTDNRTTELLREGLTEHGIEWRSGLKGVTFVGDWCFVEYDNGKLAATCEPVLTPEQAIAATLGDDEYESKMDALLCRLTNGKWSKSRSYDLDFIVSCVDEEFEELYAKELADATLGNGTLTAEQVRDVFLENFEKAYETSYDLWEPSTFNWQAIADELNTRAERTCNMEESFTKPLNPDGLPIGLTISDDGTLLNWEGENYVLQSIVRDVKRKPNGNAALGVGECEWQLEHSGTLKSKREKELEELVRDIFQFRCRQSCADCEHEDDEGCDFMTRALELGIEVD